jgi:hypothetical protein
MKNANEIADRVTTLLNLIMPEAVFPLYTYQFIDSICYGIRSMGPMTPYIPAAQVIVLEDQREALISFWKRLESSPNLAAIETAVRRFLYASKRALQSDAFIDYVISLESILSSDEPNEISFRLSLRLAVLVGRNTQERTGIFANMRKLYGLRSKVLHGSANETTLAEKTQDLRRYTKRLILRVLELSDRLDLPRIERDLLATEFGAITPES